MSQLYNRKSSLSSQEDEPFIEVVGIPSNAFYESMRIARQQSEGEDGKQWAMNEERTESQPKVGKKTLMAAVFFVIVGLVSFFSLLLLCLYSSFPIPCVMFVFRCFHKVLFITGMSIYFQSTKDDPHNGLEMLIIGIISKYTSICLYFLRLKYQLFLINANYSQ